MADPLVRLNTDGAVATVILNRPQRRNALNQALLARLYDVLDQVRDDSRVRVVVLTGAGPAFCAGLDLAAIGRENLVDPRGDGLDLPDLLEALDKPLIGAINGPAVTGGFELALNCDFLIASPRAAFADTHVRMGIHPGWGMSQLLQDAIGRRHALQFSLTGAWIDAARALSLGLVNEVVPEQELMPRAREVAMAIAGADAAMVTLLRRLIRNRRSATLDQALGQERAGFSVFIQRHQIP
jgi:enoyl-CoA hydratase